jgi:hypothetical protein
VSSEAGQQHISTMRNVLVVGTLLVVAAVASAFSPASTSTTITRGGTTTCFSTATKNNDCGCGNAATISGSPSEQARLINPREALSKSTVYRLDGSSVAVKDLLTDGVNLVVVTRSFG